MNKKIYRVRGIDLDHNGKRYQEGSQIELDDREAAGKRRWLEPAMDQQSSVEPPKQTKADDKKATENKKTAEDDGGKTDDNGQTTGQGKETKQ